MKNLTVNIGLDTDLNTANVELRIGEQEHGGPSADTIGSVLARITAAVSILAKDLGMTPEVNMKVAEPEDRDPIAEAADNLERAGFPTLADGVRESAGMPKGQQDQEQGIGRPRGAPGEGALTKLPGSGPRSVD
jgi:hypothetical protein